MRSSSVGRAFSVARQGIELGVDFGVHSVEALLWIAETIEESVYHAGSLSRAPEGVRFLLRNPPLRAGAFSAFRLTWNGARVDPARVRLRAGPDAAWRTGASVTSATPVDLLPGRSIEVTAGIPPADIGTTATVRLELECPAIPPLVWVEFRDSVRSG
ncbi:MAG: hypothetical protein WBG19_09270 [Thermoplasmata archaeon]